MTGNMHKELSSLSRIVYAVGQVLEQIGSRRIMKEASSVNQIDVRDTGIQN